MNNQFDPNDQNNQNMNGMNPISNNVGPEPMNNPAFNGLGEQSNMNNQPMDNSVPPMTDPALVGYGPNTNNMNPQPMNNPAFNGLGEQPNMNNQPMDNSVPPMTDPALVGYGPNTNNMNQQPNISSNPTNKPKFNPLIIVLVVLAVGIVILACAFLLNGFNSNYKAPIEQYCKAFNDLDSESLKNAFPKEIRNNNDVFEDMDSIINSMKETTKSQSISFSIKCDISDGEKISSSDLKEYNDDFNKNYKVNLKVSAMYEVDVKLKMTAKYNDQENNNDLDQTMYVGRINGKWYILNA